MRKLTAREFNSCLCPEARTQIVDFKTFKKWHTRTKSASIECFFSQIERVTQCKDHITARFTSGTVIKAYFGGYYESIDPNGKIIVKGDSKSKCIDSNHIRIFVKGGSVPLELFIAVCSDIMRNEMPLSYKGWTANVMDGSGSVDNAKRLGICPNFHPDNIEWCLYADGNTHEGMARLIFHLTKRVYRFSANDRKLREVAQTASPEVLRRFCDERLDVVK